MRKRLIPLAFLALASCRDRTSFAPNVMPTPIPAFQFNGVLATYNNPTTGNKETATLGGINVSTDRSKVEFPLSKTMVTLTTVDAGPGGVGSGRALRMDFNLPQQSAVYAGDSTGCPNTTPYAYMSISQQLVPDGAPAMDLSGFSTVSFWLKCDQSIDLTLAFNCQGTSRPYTTGASGGYIDSAYTVKNPCWYGGKTQMIPFALPTYSNPLHFNGGSVWQKITIPLSAFTDASTAGISSPALTCGLGYVREIAYTFNKSTPMVAGEYPADSGTIYFDDLVFE